MQTPSCICTYVQSPVLFYIAITHHGRSNPNPFIQILYFSIVEAQSFWGSLALLKSMHSSRLAFSSLHTQHGYFISVTRPLQNINGVTFGAAAAAGLRSTMELGPEGVANRVSRFFEECNGSTYTLEIPSY